MKILLYLLIISCFYINDFKCLFWLAFFLGLCFDLIFGNLVGVSSIYFLSVCFLVFIYRRRFIALNPIFQLFFVFFIFIIDNFLAGSQFFLKKTFLFLVFSLLIFSFLNKIKKPDYGLKVDL